MDRTPGNATGSQKEPATKKDVHTQVASTDAHTQRQSADAWEKPQWEKERDESKKWLRDRDKRLREEEAATGYQPGDETHEQYQHSPKQEEPQPDPNIAKIVKEQKQQREHPRSPIRDDPFFETLEKADEARKIPVELRDHAELARLNDHLDGRDWEEVLAVKWVTLQLPILHSDGKNTFHYYSDGKWAEASRAHLGEVIARICYGKLWATNQHLNCLIDSITKASFKDDASWNNATVINPYTGEVFVNVLNGVVCVAPRSGRIDLIEHDPSFFFTDQLPVDYRQNVRIGMGHTATAAFLKHLLGDAVSTAQMFFGSVLKPSTELEKCLLLIGETGTGKSTLANMIQSILGPIACTSLSLDQMLRDPFSVPKLRRALLNISAELTGDRKESSLFKMLVSGDLIGYRRLFHESQDTRFPCKHLMMNNDMIEWERPSSAEARRLILIPCDKVPAKVDTKLIGKLSLPIEAETNLIWMLDGLVRVQQEDPTWPEPTREMLELRDEYDLANNPFELFYRRRITEGKPDDFITNGDLFAAYNNFMQDRSWPPLTDDQRLAGVLTRFINRKLKVKNARKSINNVQCRGVKGAKLLEDKDE
jgi:hypothetical protein